MKLIPMLCCNSWAKAIAPPTTVNLLPSLPTWEPDLQPWTKRCFGIFLRSPFRLAHQLTEGTSLKISVITAVCNRADSIAQAVQSVQAQSWPDVEHVVIDGGMDCGSGCLLYTSPSPRDGLLSRMPS